MKLTVKITKQVEAKYLQVNAGVRYWEDAIVDGVQDEHGTLIPCRIGDNWNLLIDVDKGKILNWRDGITAETHYKVCDAGRYSLVDEDKNVITEYDGYVPKCLQIEDNGYGDYIIIKILSDGTIANWSIDTIEDDFNKEE